MNSKLIPEYFNLKPINFGEFIGILLGDGYIYFNTKQNVYFIEITGNVNETHYYQRISNYIFNVTKKKPKIKKRIYKNGKALKLIFNNKKFIEHILIIGVGPSPKTFSTKIPQKMMKWKISKHIIRGLFETDGSLYFSKYSNKKLHTYPRVEIKTSSIILLNQIVEILSKQKFNPTIRQSRTDRTYGILLSGKSNLMSWKEKIGFNTIKNLSKYFFYSQHGYFVPNMSISKRLSNLKREWPSG